MKGLNSYTAARFKSLRKALKQYKSAPRIKTLHKLRVEIKRIKVVLLLVKAADKEFSAHKAFLPLRYVFRKAGAIRQGDVLYRLLLLYQIEHAREKRPERNSGKLTAAFQREVPEFERKITAAEKALRPFLKKIHQKNVRTFKGKAMAEFKTLVYPELRTTKLHYARKQVKQILYLADIRNRKPDTFFKRAEAILGDWHDKQVLMSHIRKSNVSDRARLNKECEADLRRLAKKANRYYN